MPAMETISQKIIQQTDKLLDDRATLSNRQVQKLQTIHRCTLDFLRTYHARHKLSQKQLQTYLQWEAINPITMMVGYSELMMMGFCGKFTDEQQKLIHELNRYCYMLQDMLQTHQKKAEGDAATAQG
ncbi:MAG: hypothetical protein ACPG7F_18220 [Aggregatilineales bacterium]